MCPLCRLALSSGGNPRLVEGFYWSIALMVSVPLIIMGVVGFLVWRHRRRTRVGSVRGTIDA